MIINARLLMWKFQIAWSTSRMIPRGVSCAKSVQKTMCFLQIRKTNVLVRSLTVMNIPLSVRITQPLRTPVIVPVMIQWVVWLVV
jgi:hypothetical protein